MEFDKIRFDGKTVELEYTERTSGGAEAKVAEHGDDPTPAFKAALQAFVGYVVWVISAPEAWAETITVRGVSIKRHEDQPRGIVVTAVRQCLRARNGTMLINTPFLTERPEGGTGEGAGFLPDHVPALIDDLENEAALYHGGERGEQTSLELETSENTKQFNDNAAAAEVKSTRKPRSKKGKDFIPGVGDVANPDATEVLTDEKLRQLLLMVERDVPIDAIATWTSSDRSASETWARARQRELAGSAKPDETVPDEPACVKASATLPLTADVLWSDPEPVRPGDEGVHAIQDAARG